MSDLAKIEVTLRRAARRRRLGRGIRNAWTGLLGGAIASLLLTATYHLLPIGGSWLYWAAVAPGIGGLIWFAAGWLPRPDLLSTARWLDRTQHLQERLSTAVETAGMRSTSDMQSPFEELLLRDAANCVAQLDPKRAVAYHVALAGKLAAILLLATAVLGFIPEYRSQQYQQAQRDAENIKETGRRLAEITRREIERRSPRLETTRSALEATANLGDRLAARPPNRDEALRELANAAERLEQAAAAARTPSARQAEQAARANGGAFKSPAELQKQIEALQEQLEAATATPEQLKKLENELRMAARTATDMSVAGASGADLSNKLGTSLSQLSAAARDFGIDLPKLEDAMRALAADQTGLFLKNLEGSVIDLEKLAQIAQALQAAEQQAAQLGKDLAEQLTKGQGQAAQETLEKMAKKLQNGQVSPSEMKQILEEVSKAVNPAGNYGEVSKHLKDAADEMRRGRQANAGNALQNAANELSKLMDQLGDAQAALAAVDSLRQASMAVGSGRMWAPGQQQGKRPGATAGPGVGTWSDAQQTWDGTVAEMPDDSGIRRPESESRSGLADPEPGPELTPSKVRGQFSEGAQMPSISLRGVGIKGQSKVAYEEAATAAQAEAESALGQDKIPRAYRDSVRNYFDELKK